MRNGRDEGGPLRVLHVVATDQRRGAEVFAADLIRALEGQVEQRVAILRRVGPGGLAFPAPVTSLPAAGWRLPGPRLDLSVLRGLRGLLRTWPPTLIQAHGGEPFKYAIPAAWRGGTPVIYRRIGWSWARGRARVALHGLLIRRAARVVAVAEAVRQETVERFGLPAERVVTIPRGVDPRRLRPSADRASVRRSLGLADGVPVVLSLGALAWEKDPLGALEAAARALQAVPGAVYLVAGEGPIRPELEGAIRRRGLQDRVRVLGDRADVGDLLAASDVLLSSSVSEGMPGALIEAGMAGVPAVAPAVAGIPEVVEDGVTGVLVARDDRDGLGAALETLLRDGPRRVGLGSAARERYGERFAIEGVARRYLVLYEELAEGR